MILAVVPRHLRSIYFNQDFTKRNGTGGESIYGGPFPDEDLSRPLDAPGYVDMTHVHMSPYSNTYQFTLHGQQGPQYQQLPILRHAERMPALERYAHVLLWYLKSLYSVFCR